MNDYWTRRPAALGALCAALAFALGGCAGSSRELEREQDLKRARSHFDLGADHLRNGRDALALREFLNAERFNPLDARTQYALGTTYWAKQKLDEAERHLLRALELYPDYHDARLSLSALYVESERYAEAIAACQLLMDDPTFPAPWRALTNVGWAQYKLGLTAEARGHLEEALDYNRKYWPALLDLGILEHQEGRLLEAIQMFQRMLELEPGPGAEAEANYRLAEIYISLGKRDRAVGHLTAAVAQTPRGPWGRKSEEYLKLLR